MSLPNNTLFTILMLINFALCSYAQTGNNEVFSTKNFNIINPVSNQDDEVKVIRKDPANIKINNTDIQLHGLSHHIPLDIKLPDNINSNIRLLISPKDKLKKEGIMPGNLSLSGGIGLKSWYDEQLSYIFNFTGTYFFNRNLGTRANVDLNFFPRKNETSYPDFYEEGGNISLHFFTIDLMAGSFKPESKSTSYFIFGAGIVTFSESERVSHTSYGTYTNTGETQTYFVANLGGGFSYKPTHTVKFGGEIFYGFTPQYIQFGLISLKPKLNFAVSKNLELFTEPQYTFPVVIGGDGGFFVGDGYLTVKTGVTWNLY